MKSCCKVKCFVGSLVLLLLVLWVSYTWVDLPVTIWASQLVLPMVIKKALLWLAKVTATEVWMVLALVLLLFGLGCRKCVNDPRAYRLFGGGILVAIAIGDILKISLARYRPENFFNHQLYGFHGFAMQRTMASMPSGHTLGTFAAITALILIVRKPWVSAVAILFGVIVACSRVLLLQHFVSDVILGAYVGVWSTYFVSKWLDCRKCGQDTQSCELKA